MILSSNLLGALSLLASSATLPAEHARPDLDPWGFPKSEEFRAQIDTWRTGPYLVELILPAPNDAATRPDVMIQGAVDGVWFVEHRRSPSFSSPVSTATLIATNANIGEETPEFVSWYLSAPDRQVELRHIPTFYSSQSPGPNDHRRVTAYVEDRLLHPRRLGEDGRLTFDTNAPIHPTPGEKAQQSLFTPLAAMRGEIPSPTSWEPDEDGTRVVFRLAGPGVSPEREAPVTVVVCEQTGRVTQWAWGDVGGSTTTRGAFVSFHYDSETNPIPSKAVSLRRGSPLTQTILPVASAEAVTGQMLMERISAIHTNDTMGSLPDGASDSTSGRVVPMSQVRAFVGSFWGIEPLLP